MYTVVAAGGAAGVNGSTAGGAAVVGYSTAGGAVEVNYSAAGRQQGVSIAIGGSSKISVGCRQSSNGQIRISCRHGSGLSG